MPTIAEHEALLKELTEKIDAAEKSWKILKPYFEGMIDRRKKGVAGDQEADTALRENSKRALDKLSELNDQFERALKNAGLPEHRRTFSSQ